MEEDILNYSPIVKKTYKWVKLAPPPAGIGVTFEF